MSVPDGQHFPPRLASGRACRLNIDRGDELSRVPPLDLDRLGTQ
jgi:hypothetical protein